MTGGVTDLLGALQTRPLGVRVNYPTNNLILKKLLPLVWVKREILNHVQKEPLKEDFHCLVDDLTVVIETANSWIVKSLSF